MFPEALSQERSPLELDNILDRTACPDFDDPYNPEAFSLSLEIELACQDTVEREKNRLAAKAAAEQAKSPNVTVTPEKVPPEYYDDLVAREKKFALKSLEALLELEASIFEEASKLFDFEELKELDDFYFADDLSRAQASIVSDKFIAIVPDWDRVRGNTDDAGESLLRPAWVPLLRAAKSRLRVRVEVGGGVSTRPLKSLSDDRSHVAYPDMYNPEFTESTSDSPLVQDLDSDLLSERNPDEDKTEYENLAVEEKKALQTSRRERTWAKYKAVVGHLLRGHILEQDLPGNGLVNEKAIVWAELLSRYPNGYFLFMDDEDFARTVVPDHPRFRALHVDTTTESRLANDWRYTFGQELDPEFR